MGIPFSGYPTGVNTATAVSLGVVSTESALFQTIMVSGSTQSGTTTFDVSNPRSIYYENRFSGYTYQCLVDGWTGWTGCYGETGFTYCISTGVPTDICDGETGFTENYINNWTMIFFNILIHIWGVLLMEILGVHVVLIQAWVLAIL